MIDAMARYWAAVRRLRNTDLEDEENPVTVRLAPNSLESV
jgi:hypothetical protein